ncbi:MAG: hypothetical protein OXI69_14185 [Acidobacteriota bacterium]|nr:hypothetical protein [Acidobacteriota bacterium]
MPGGIIQNWTGAVFIPGGSLPKTLKLLQDYDRHRDIYPDVVDSSPHISPGRWRHYKK